eukprot:GILK01013502.1.p1 GENE.GILK01013502.1~~GILK01013502.1.p1  ORF type:complete len:253 (-),score=15.47 GILK01013502.1:147-905(-)
MNAVDRQLWRNRSVFNARVGRKAASGIHFSTLTNYYLEHPNNRLVGPPRPWAADFECLPRELRAMGWFVVNCERKASKGQLDSDVLHQFHQFGLLLEYHSVTQTASPNLENSTTNAGLRHSDSVTDSPSSQTPSVVHQELFAECEQSIQHCRGILDLVPTLKGQHLTAVLRECGVKTSGSTVAVLRQMLHDTVERRLQRSVKAKDELQLTLLRSGSTSSFGNIPNSCFLLQMMRHQLIRIRKVSQAMPQASI